MFFTLTPHDDLDGIKAVLAPEAERAVAAFKGQKKNPLKRLLSQKAPQKADSLIKVTAASFNEECGVCVHHSEH